RALRFSSLVSPSALALARPPNTAVAAPAPPASARSSLRRSNSCSLIASSVIAYRLCRSRRQREGLLLDVDKYASERTNAGIEVRRFAPLETRKEAPHPGRDVVFEDMPVRAGQDTQGPSRQSRHDLAQHRGMVLGLGLAVGLLDTDAQKI